MAWIWQQTNWPRFHWDTSSIFECVEKVVFLQGKLTGLIHGFDTSINNRVDTLVGNILSTSLIEGESLNPQQVRSSVLSKLGDSVQGLPGGSAQTDAITELILDATQNCHDPVTAERFHSWHRRLFPERDEPWVGEWRGEGPMRVVSGVLGREQIHYEAIAWHRVPDEMAMFIDSLDEPDGVNPMVRAAVAHLWFLTIHPYRDGNGRIARALTDLMLARYWPKLVNSIALSSTIIEQRKSYYASLEETQKGDLDITRWIQWFFELIRHGLLESCSRAEWESEKAAFWLRNETVQLSSRQRKAVNRMIREGPKGFVGGLTAKKYQSLCRTSKATATRELSDLVVKGILVRRGHGRAASYELALHV